MTFKHTEQVRSVAVVQLGEIGKALAIRPRELGEPCAMLHVVLEELRDIIHSVEKPAKAQAPVVNGQRFDASTNPPIRINDILGFTHTQRKESP